MPPFDGPRATLCVTRQPVKTCTEPSSIVVGIETSTAFLHSPRIATRSSSIPNTSATFRSCCWAIRNGFSVRWSHARRRAYAVRRPTLSGRRSCARLGGAGQRRPGDEADLVAARRERRAARAAAGERRSCRCRAAGRARARARRGTCRSSCRARRRAARPARSRRRRRRRSGRRRPSASAGLESEGENDRGEIARRPSSGRR